MIDIFKNTEVNAALAASIFHYETHSVNRVKEMIKQNGIRCKILEFMVSLYQVHMLPHIPQNDFLMW